MELLRYIPKSYLSFFMGRLSAIVIPEPFRGILIRWFARRYTIDVSEASRPIDSYRSISEFFVRDLRPGVRPIEAPFVSPVDGTLRNSGVAVEGVIEQIKGRTYSVLELLGDSQEAERFQGGRYFSMYLSPQDYHHVHSPVSGFVRKIVSIPGKLWPVNDWSLSSIDKLFAVNERVVIYISTHQGEIAVVMVGATNVGKISLSFDSLVTNTAPWSGQNIYTKEYSPTQIPLNAGDRIGTFHLGSSVVMICDTALSETCAVGLVAPAKVRYGQNFCR